MTPQLIFVLGTIMHIIPMQNMDACKVALEGLDRSAQYRSYCIDGRTGEVIRAK